MGLRTNPVSDSCDSELHQEQHTATDSNRTTCAEKVQQTTSKDHFSSVMHYHGEPQEIIYKGA